jgi:hypothetical protein
MLMSQDPPTSEPFDTTVALLTGEQPERVSALSELLNVQALYRELTTDGQTEKAAAFYAVQLVVEAVIDSMDDAERTHHLAALETRDTSNALYQGLMHLSEIGSELGDELDENQALSDDLFRRVVSKLRRQADEEAKRAFARREIELMVKQLSVADILHWRERD